MLFPVRCPLTTLVACSSLLLGAAHLSAATCYVAVSGSDTNDGLSPDKAWKTVTHAASKAATGDTVYIKAGLYRGEKVVIRNCIATDSEVDNIWLLRTNNCVVENCKTYGTIFEGEASTDYYIILTDSHNTVVRDCLAHNLHAEHFTEHPGKGHPGHGIGIKDRSAPKGYGQPHSDKNRIINCVARNMGEHFYVAHEALNNEFVNCTATSQFRTQAYWCYGLVMRDGAHDNSFRDCRVEGARTSIGIQETVEGPNNPDGSPLNQICSKNTLANCIFVDANVGLEIGNADDNLIRNCVFDNTGEWALVRFVSSDRNRRLDHRNQGNTCRNTIATNVRGAFRAADKDVSDQVIFSCSNFWKNSFKMPAGTGNMTQDPLFADAGKRDYHLKSRRGRWDKASAKWVKDPVSSPCIDAGAPADDFSNEPKPDGGRIDIGAYGGINDAPAQGDETGAGGAGTPDT